jgi:hypothetical protein
MIEPLESRIAPAQIFSPVNFTDTQVNPKTGAIVFQFYNAANGPSLPAPYSSIAETFGLNPNVYFIKLTAGQELKVQTKSGPEDLINVTKGNVIATFTDFTPNNALINFNDYNELTGLSLGNKVSVSVGGGVNGDIVTNYNDKTGALGGSTEVLGAATQLLPNIVTNLFVAGPVESFVAGANVDQFHATGTVNQVLTGTAANGYNYSLVAIQNSDHTFSPLITGTLTVGTPAARVAGPSLFNVTMAATNLIKLGNGGEGAAGGSLKGLTLLGDDNGFTVQAGAGGQGGATRSIGGAGGIVSGVVVNGPASASTSNQNSTPPPADPTPNSPIIIMGGTGGAGLGTAHGGAGGAVQAVFIDYNSASATDPSANTLQDNVTLQGGDGGAGGSAGAGGGLSNIHVLTSTPHDLTPNAIEIQILGGNGGKTTVGGRGGAGGSINNATVSDIGSPATVPNTTLANDADPLSPTNTHILLSAGAGGSDVVSGKGGAGGSIGTVALKGYNFELDAGSGGQGVSAGGAGGAVNAISVSGSATDVPGDNFHAKTLTITGGTGAEGTQGNGGAGGGVTGISVVNSDFGIAGLTVTTGSGGQAGKGAGGAGGGMSNVQVNDVDFVTALHPLGDSGTATLTTGDGGSAPVANGKGGAGGSIVNVTIVGTRLASSATAGKGGSAGTSTAPGTGGAGGTITSVALRSAEDAFPTIQEITTASAGLLTDSNASFVTTDNVQVGDFVTNTLTGVSTTVTAVVSDTQLALASDIFAVNDPYNVVVPSATVGLPNNNYQGAQMEDPGKTQDTIVDGNANFIAAGVQVGDVIQDIPDSNAAGVPITATVTAVTSATELQVSADISHVGDQYAFIALGTGTANYVQYNLNTIVDANANFKNEGVTAGTLIQDVTATAASEASGNGPVFSTVVGVTDHSLTLADPISVVGDQYDFPALGQAHFTAGIGGAGTVTGKGGAGGSIINSNADVPGSVFFTGGAGGSGGTTGAGGAGGSLNGIGAFSTYGSGIVIAGGGGLATGVGSKAAAGGTISGSDVQVLKDVTLIAGNGTAGGAGGNVNSSSFSGVLQDGAGFNPPAGNITIEAGNGGNTAMFNGGAGGSISGLTGFISTGDGVHAFTTQFDAGTGGNGLNKAGGGGSVDHVRFFGGGGQGVTFFINAGDAGNASNGKTGATGGSVTDIGGGANSTGNSDPNFSVNPLTNFHHISAGNGGAAVTTGGLGGSVTNVFVNAAIGVRTGANFGFDLAGAGGISAGAGGSGLTPGVAGNVTQIAADAIASIVAGHLNEGDALTISNLANKVDGIVLNGSTAPSLTHTFQLSFAGETTVAVPTDASPLQVASALNALPSIQAVGGVGVVNGPNGYVVTFRNNGTYKDGQGNHIALTAFEPTVENNGATTELVVGTPTTTNPNNGNTVQGTNEEQQVNVTLKPFTLSFNGFTTPLLTSNATLQQVSNALNSLPSIQNAGGVNVTKAVGSNNNNYDITFGAVGPEPLVTPNYSAYTTEVAAGGSGAAVDEVQNIHVFGTDPFSLAFQGDMTTPLAANASAMAVATALNALPEIQSATANQGVSVSGGPDNYQITFNAPGVEQQLITPDIILGQQTVVGTTSTPEIVTLTFPTRGDFSPPQFSTANLVGSIANVLRPNASGAGGYAFTNLVGGNGFQFGDAPIDGLIAAANLTAGKNFVPQAFVTADASGVAHLFDNANG